MSADQKITIEAFRQLGKNRPGRKWLRENRELWVTAAESHRVEAAKLEEMVQLTDEILAADEERPDEGGPGEE